jgi:hypothetical protein
MAYRTIELYPAGLPANQNSMVAEVEAVNHLIKSFRECMLLEDSFRSEAIVVDDAQPIFCAFNRINQTAAIAIFTRYQIDELNEAVRRGFDGISLMLSGVSQQADHAVIQMFEELVTAPVLKTTDFTTQNYGIEPEFVQQVKRQQPPVGMNIYLRPKAVDETAVVSAAAAATIAFFGLLGAADLGK